VTREETLKMCSLFVQLHTLTSYPSSLLNRDDVGFAKRIPFGGAVRTRISSQCLKKHWRAYDGHDGLRDVADGAELSVRSRVTFERYVVQPLVAAGKDHQAVKAATEAVLELVLGKSEKKKADEMAETEKTGKKAKKAADGEPLPEVRTEQVTVLGHPELRYIRDFVASLVDAGEALDSKALAKRLDKDVKENLRALRCAAGLDAAMFGRMVTSDILARGDAAVHVAHAFTVHAEQAETDYFTAVDDLLTGTDEGGSGSGHVNSSELTSGLYYTYVVLDVPLLVSNLEGCERADWTKVDRELAAKLAGRLVKMLATVSPGAKRGSTAPHAYAHLVAAEIGAAQPRTLANAFLRPVSERGDLLRNTYDAVRAHLEDLDAMYGAVPRRAYAALEPADALGTVLGKRGPLAEVAGVVEAAIRDGGA